MAAVSRKSGIYSQKKKLASPTGNTGEALQCVRLHQKAPESACRKFKLTTEHIFISGTLRRCLRWDLVLEAEPKSSSSYGNDIRQVSYRTWHEKFSIDFSSGIHSPKIKKLNYIELKPAYRRTADSPRSGVLARKICARSCNLFLSGPDGPVFSVF